MKKEYRVLELHPSSFIFLPSNGGQGGIRTHEAVTPTRVPVVLLQPLGHLSNKNDEYGMRNDESNAPTHHLSFRIHHSFGGQRGIRTPDTLSRTIVFETIAFNHSAICPSKHFTTSDKPCHLFSKLRPIHNPRDDKTANVIMIFVTQTKRGSQVKLLKDFSLMKTFQDAP